MTIARLLLIPATCAAIALSGCANMDNTQRGTAAGAGIGALAGAAIGAATKSDKVAGAAIGGIAGAVIGNIWSMRMEAQKQAMEKATEGTGVAVSRTEDNQLKLNIPNDISFDTGSAALKPELRDVLSQFAKGLGDNPSALVKIVGHTDSVGTDANNQRLSNERADAVRDFLTDRGVGNSRVAITGHGEREPIASNDTAEGRAKNRRVEIFLREPETAQK